MIELAATADRLLSLHRGPPLVLPNAWDVASALAVERAGAAAVATTSSGVAESLGYPDGEAIPPAEMFAAVARMAAAVSVPVTADVEAGYGLDPAELVSRLLDAGAVGLNIEDTSRAGGEDRLADAGRQVELLSAIRNAAEAAGVHLVINARIDVFLRGSGSPAEGVEEALRRAHAYLDAGADCVYPIWLTDARTIRRIVAETRAPVNVLLRAQTPTFGELEAMGVARISVGGGLARHAMAYVEELARELVAGEGAGRFLEPDEP